MFFKKKRYIVQATRIEENDWRIITVPHNNYNYGNKNLLLSKAKNFLNFDCDCELRGYYILARNEKNAIKIARKMIRNDR